MKKPARFKKKFKHSYAKLHHVGRKHYGDNNFCALIAAAVINDWSFGIAKSKMEKRGYRVHGNGVYFSDSLALYAEHGKVAVKVEADKFGKTLASVAKNVPKEGRFVWHVRGHIAASRDGILEDWSAEHPKRYRILECYEILDIDGLE